MTVIKNAMYNVKKKAFISFHFPRFTGFFTDVHHNFFREGGKAWVAKGDITILFIGSTMVLTLDGNSEHVAHA